MSGFRSCIYAGRVVHKRLTPRQHAFAYRVFSLCLDLDEIDELDKALRLFSRNRFNLAGFHDRDHGAGDGRATAEQARALLAEAGLQSFGARISLLTYPRLLGYVFNPLSVYFCHDDRDRVGAVVYEVTNTFRERRSYVVPVGADGGGTLVQHCGKQLYVSPFTRSEGRYGFHVRPPGDDVLVGVAFREAGQPVLKTHFSGHRLPLDDRVLARLSFTHPLLTLKVIGAIHWEAARLWLAGIPVQQRRASPAYAVSLAGSEREKLDD